MHFIRSPLPSPPTFVASAGLEEEAMARYQRSGSAHNAVRLAKLVGNDTQLMQIAMQVRRGWFNKLVCVCEIAMQVGGCAAVG